MNSSLSESEQPRRRETQVLSLDPETGMPPRGKPPMKKVPSLDAFPGPEVARAVERGKEEARKAVYTTYDATRVNVAVLLEDFPAYPFETGPEGKKRLGNFEIREKLGEGAFGQAFKAFDSWIGRDVVIKILHPSVDREDSEKQLDFIREMRIMAKQNDPHITSVYVAGRFKNGRHQDQLFTVMEYCPGGNLEKITEEIKFLRLDQAEKLQLLKNKAFPLVQAMGKMHKNGYIHADIKPENILVDDNTGWKFADFGYAQSIQHARQDPEDIFGTLHYMAPEYVAGIAKTANPATDSYSFAVSMYEVFTGKQFFPGVDFKKFQSYLALAAKKGSPPSVTEELKKNLDKALPPNTASLLLRMMDAKVTNRIPVESLVEAWKSAIAADEALLKVNHPL